MASESKIMSAQERLSISRQALVHQLQGTTAPPEIGSAVKSDRPASRSSGFAWASILRNVVRRWWQRHPANAVTQVALPVLDRYTTQRPFKAVGVAAAAGALIVFVRPWRLLSVTAVLAAVLKTSDVADMVTTLMQTKSRSRDR